MVALGYVPARGLPLLLLVSVAHAAVLAPLTPLADALALGSASSKQGFAYGWVRGAGSAAFIVGTLLSGQMVERAGLGTIVWLNSGLLAVAAAAICLFIPDRLAGNASKEPTPSRSGAGPWRALLGIPVFARLMAIAALVGGSHALHDGLRS
jgi:PPP family 3-phenylpropionic acid transporter